MVNIGPQVLPRVTSTITLPNIDHEPFKKTIEYFQINHKQKAGQRQKRIMIIDDDPDVTTTFHMALEQYGFKTDSYTEPVLAYQNFREGLYDLVLLDIKMPEVDGFLLYQKIKMTDSGIKICFITASEFYYEEFRKEHGFGDFKQETFLRKPIEIPNLVHAIKKLLESE